MHGCGFFFGFLWLPEPGLWTGFDPLFAWCGLVLIGRVAWLPICKVWFARCVGIFYLVGLPVGNCCSCIELLPFSYVHRGGAVSFSVSQGTCFL